MPSLITKSMTGDGKAARRMCQEAHGLYVLRTNIELDVITMEVQTASLVTGPCKGCPRPLGNTYHVRFELYGALTNVDFQ